MVEFNRWNNLKSITSRRRGNWKKEEFRQFRQEQDDAYEKSLKEDREKVEKAEQKKGKMEEEAEMLEAVEREHEERRKKIKLSEPLSPKLFLQMFFFSEKLVFPLKIVEILFQKHFTKKIFDNLKIENHGGKRCPKFFLQIFYPEKVVFPLKIVLFKKRHFRKAIFIG